MENVVTALNVFVQFSDVSELLKRALILYFLLTYLWILYVKAQSIFLGFFFFFLSWLKLSSRVKELGSIKYFR